MDDLIEAFVADKSPEYTRGQGLVISPTTTSQASHVSTNRESRAGLYAAAERQVGSGDDTHAWKHTTTTIAHTTPTGSVASNMRWGDATPTLTTPPQQWPETYNHCNHQSYKTPSLDKNLSLASNPWSTGDHTSTPQSAPVYTPEDAWSTSNPPTTPPQSPAPTYTRENPWSTLYSDSDHDNDYDDDEPLSALPLPQSKSQVRILIEALRLSDMASVSRDERQGLLVDKHKAVQQHRKALKTSLPAWQGGKKTWKETIGLGGGGGGVRL